MWREIKTDDVLKHFTPAEQNTLNNILAGADTLSDKITDGVGTVRGFILAGANQVDASSATSIPDQLRTHAIAFILWDWLSAFPALKAFKSDDRKQAAKDAEELFKLIGSQDAKRPRVEPPPTFAPQSQDAVTMPSTGHTKLHQFKKRKEDGII